MNINANHSNRLPDKNWALLWGSPKTWGGFFDDARRSKARFFTSLYRPVLPERGVPSTLHFSVIASKKNVSNSSVTRHRAKRRLKAAVTEAAKQLALEPQPSSYQWVLLANRQAVEAPWNLLVEDIKKAMRGLLQGGGHAP